VLAETESQAPSQAHLRFMQPVVVVLIAMELARQVDQASEEMVEELPQQQTEQ
jgi:hypothetical protein